VTDIEPPTDDLAALFANERDVSQLERVAIRNKLAATIAAPAPATAAIATTKLVWIGVAAIATAAGIWWWTHRAATAPTRVPPPTPELTAPAPEPSITTTAPESAAPAVTLEPTAQTPRTPSQTELLAEAWKALPRNPARSLELVALDQRVHANGALSEERAALHVQALVALGRREEARILAQTFLTRYPDSVHKKQIEAVAGGAL